LVAQLSQEIYQNDLLQMLVQNIARLEFEVWCILTLPSVWYNSFYIHIFSFCHIYHHVLFARINMRVPSYWIVLNEWYKDILNVRLGQEGCGSDLQ
jgi:hypothetical protein